LWMFINHFLGHAAIESRSPAMMQWPYFLGETNLPNLVMTNIAMV